MPDNRRILALGLALVVASGCALGPNYKRPDVAIPETIRGRDGAADATSIADLRWWEVFQDPKLQALLTEAIASNHNLKAATARVEQARNLVAVARADMLPQLGYDAGAGRARNQATLYNPTNDFVAAVNLAWEVDLWGRIRRGTEAARADFYAAEDVRRGVLLSLVSDVATGYFELLTLYIELAITNETAATFRNTLDLFQRRYEGGIGTLLEVSRAKAALTETEAGIPDLERLIVAKENQLSLLLGRTPGRIVCQKDLGGQFLPPTIPVGLPSQLLERRPDLLAAEQAVVAANAEVGVALANFFPRIGLTALYGGQSSELENIVKHSGNVWAAAGSLTGPLFQGGRLLAGYRASDARLDEAAERYEQAVLQAFAEVSSLLVSHEKLKGMRLKREESVAALQLSVTLSLQRYTDGISSYFEVLEAQQQFFPAALTLVRTQRDEMVTMVALYRALGGGWKYSDSGAQKPGAATAASSAGRLTAIPGSSREESSPPSRAQ
jgi:multidrug efflux system outer membrane protein